MDLLSSVRLGINLGLLDDLTIATVNELFIQTQPAHLQKLRAPSWASRSGTSPAPRTCAAGSPTAGSRRLAADVTNRGRVDAPATPRSRSWRPTPRCTTDRDGPRRCLRSASTSTPHERARRRARRLAAGDPRGLPRQGEDAPPRRRRRGMGLPRPGPGLRDPQHGAGRAAHARAEPARRGRTGPGSPAAAGPTLGHGRSAETVRRGIHDQDVAPDHGGRTSRSSASAISGTKPPTSG